MVNFGKKLMADQIPEWKGYCSYMCKFLFTLYSEPIYYKVMGSLNSIIFQFNQWISFFFFSNLNDLRCSY